MCEDAETLECVVGAANACGGSGELVHGDAAAQPGERCALACGEGVLVCRDREGLLCVSDGSSPPANACGGCGLLPGEVDAPCGLCGEGAWVCEEEGMRCAGAAPVDACGGCSGASERPGTACQDDGIWGCDGDLLLCQAPVAPEARNACGGTASLAEEPGDSCGVCGAGEVFCAGLNRTACSVPDDEQRNACGGCGTLDGRPADPCGTCGTGTLSCEGEELRCLMDEGASARNACGGCGVLHAQPGDGCGACLEWRCAEGGTLRCEPDGTAEECAALVTCAALDCAAEHRRCVESDGTADASCGGCLAGYEEVGGSCEEVAVPTCAELSCGDENRTCDAGPPASCGGCLAGFEEQGGSCVAVPTCAELSCGDENRTCDAGPPASCGGCLVGFEESGGACVPSSAEDCAALGCAAANRACDEGPPVTCGGCLDGFELADSGACVPPLSPPEDLQASNATHAGFVRLTWSASEGAAGYHVYREGVRITTAPVTGTTFDDAAAPAGAAPAAPGSPAATSSRIGDVRVSWSAVTLPAGPETAFAVRAVDGSRQSGLSAVAFGRRGGGEVQEYEVELDGTWTSAGSGLEFLDTSAPAGRVEVSSPTASDDLLEGVSLDVAPIERVFGALRTYRVRAVGPAGPGTATSPFEGRRSVGPAVLRWQWSETGTGGWTDLAGATATAFFDDEIGPGETRWYRAVGTARVESDSGAPTDFPSTAVEGTRLAPPDPVVSCTSIFDCDAQTQWCPTDTGERVCSPAFSVGDVDFRFTYVPEGAFTMGSPETEIGRVSGEDQVEACISRPYFVQRTPVTQGQWREVMSRADASWGLTPSWHGRNGLCDTDDCPVEQVTVYEAMHFANALSEQQGLTPCYDFAGSNCTGAIGTGCPDNEQTCINGTYRCNSTIPFAGPSCEGYRLPTEAEWERAARAGTTGATWLGELEEGPATTCTNPGPQPSQDPIAWWCGNSDGQTQPVATRAANPWGLFDMLGNVFEWTGTVGATAIEGGVDPGVTSIGGTVSVNARGGSFTGTGRNVRAARRLNDQTPRQNRNRGFRLVRTADLEPVPGACSGVGSGAMP
ncbi:MAG: hypothetical protein EA398_15070 [Deltaproteobacteria bacterium]|nr:MAG: hypothetical protein EA398_15070 [Deltaproteobacteria bacterium]